MSADYETETLKVYVHGRWDDPDSWLAIYGKGRGGDYELVSLNYAILLELNELRLRWKGVLRE